MPPTSRPARTPCGVRVGGSHHLAARSGLRIVDHCAAPSAFHDRAVHCTRHHGAVHGTPATTAAPTTVPATRSGHDHDGSPLLSGHGPAPHRSRPRSSTIRLSTSTHLLAWVGIVWGGVASCPATATKKAHNEAVATYEVVIDRRPVTAHMWSPIRAGASRRAAGRRRPRRCRCPKSSCLSRGSRSERPSTGIAVTVPPCGAVLRLDRATRDDRSWHDRGGDRLGSLRRHLRRCRQLDATVDSVVPLGQGGRHSPMPRRGRSTPSTPFDNRPHHNHRARPPPAEGDRRADEGRPKLRRRWPGGGARP